MPRKSTRSAAAGQKRSKAQAGAAPKRRKTQAAEKVTVEVTSDALQGMRVALSGKVTGQTQKAFEALIKSAGGTLSKSVTKSCVALVVGAKGDGTTKFSKAQELKLPLVTPEWVLDSVNSKEKKDFAAYKYGSADDCDEPDEPETEELEDQQQQEQQQEVEQPPAVEPSDENDDDDEEEEPVPEDDDEYDEPHAEEDYDEDYEE